MLQDAFAAGIERIVTISVSADNLDTVRQLAESHPSIWCTQGIHPHEANSWNTALAERVTAGCAHPRVVAVGEIGLDYHYNHADRASQLKAFEEQLSIASDLSLPVVIHTREADSDTRDILGKPQSAFVSQRRNPQLHELAGACRVLSCGRLHARLQWHHHVS